MNTPTWAMLWLLALQLLGITTAVEAYSQPNEPLSSGASTQEILANRIRQALKTRDTVSIMVENGLTERSATGKATIQAFVSRLETMGARRVHAFKHIPYALVEVDIQTFEELLASPDVARIQEDAILEPQLTESAELTGATRAWNMGGTGAGQVIAVIDTGIDSGHPFLNDAILAEACFSTTYSPSGGSYNSFSICPNGEDEQVGTGAGINVTPTYQAAIMVRG